MGDDETKSNDVQASECVSAVTPLDDYPDVLDVAIQALHRKRAGLTEEIALLEGARHERDRDRAVRRVLRREVP